MSGFLSGFKPNIKKVQRPFGNLKLRKKLEIHECTDNPPLRRSSYLTDDGSDKDIKITDKNNTTNIDQNLTDDEDIQNVSDQNKENDKKAADTVIDTMCSRMSGMNVGVMNSKRESLKAVETKKTLADTVVDSENDSQVLKEIDVPLPSRRQLFRTRVDSFPSEESDEKVDKRNVSIRKPNNSKCLQDMDVSSEEEDVIQVLDSSDEEEISKLQPAELKSSDSFINCSTSAGTLNDFFNNPPSLHSNAAITHSMIKKYNQNNQQYEDEVNRSIPLEVGDRNVTFREKISESLFNDDEHVEIPPTDESDIENDIVDLTHDESGPKSQAQNNDSNSEAFVKPTKSKTPISVNIATDTPGSSTTKIKNRNITNINIKFDLKISIRDGSASSNNDANDSASTEKSSEKEDSVKECLKALAKSPFYEQKSPEQTQSKNLVYDSPPTRDKDENSKQEMELLNDASFHTPTRKHEDKPVIDEELQSMLTDLYGNSWKTPQVLSSFKIKKFREDLRKSLAANNFESFVGSLSKDLESTRISSPKTEKPVRKRPIDSKLLKPIAYSGRKDDKIIQKTTSSVSWKTPELPEVNYDEKENNKKTSAIKASQNTPVNKNIKPLVQKSVPRTPLHDLCDPDTESEETSDENDEDFNPDDTWNASSDEDYESEKDRIKKRQSIKHGDMIFTLDDSLNDILKKYEFKPPAQISTTEKPSRRKLFTHTHYEDEEETQKKSQETPSKSQETPSRIPKKNDSNKKEVTPRELKKTPTTTAKALTVAPNSLTKIQSAPILDTHVTKKDLLKRFSKFSFLKSLDAEANKMLCDPDALYYRENYKAKKCDLADKLFKLYNEKVFSSQLSDVPIKWNKKLQTTGGRCNNSRRANVRSSLIELSDKVLTSADRLRCTLIHEMCHAAAWILNGENGHGATWKKWTAKANSVFPELPKISVCHDYVIEYRYTYMCVNCKARSQTHSKTKKVEEVRCSLCKGSIQLFENKKNSEGKLELVPVQKKEPTAFAKFVKLKFKEVKQPHLSHKEVMQILSSQFSNLAVEEKAQL